MTDAPISVGDRVFLTADARCWMDDIGVRPGTVLKLTSGVPSVEFWGMEPVWINARNLEIVGND